MCTLHQQREDNVYSLYLKPTHYIQYVSQQIGKGLPKSLYWSQTSNFVS